MSLPIPAVVSTMSFSGLGIVRSLGRRQIPVFAVDPDPHQVGMQSRYCPPVVSPDPGRDEQAYIAALIDLAEQIGGRAVLYPTGDRTVLLFSRHREQLRERFLFAMPDDELIRKVVTKDGLDAVARATGVEAPRTMFPADVEQARQLARELRYPVLIKPTLSPSWSRPEIRALIGEGTKVLVAHSASELLQAYEPLAALDSPAVFQELIPGDDDQLSYVAMYCDERGEPICGFAGRKLRLSPPHFGSATYVETVDDPELVRLAQHLVRSIGYRGLCGVEFKRDARDGKQKLIELNARYGLWDVLGEEVGVPLAHLAYRHALGQQLDPLWSHRSGVSWLGFERDFGAFRQYWREGRIGWPSWLATVIASRTHAVFAADDPQPFLAETYAWGKRVVGERMAR